MKKLFLVSMLCLTFTIPAKADFWKKLKNAVIGTDATSSSNSSGKSGGTRGYLSVYGGRNIIVNPFDKNDFRDEDDIYSEERDATYTYKNLQGITTKVDYVECRLAPGAFLNTIGYLSFYGYVKFPVYSFVYSSSRSISGCFSRDKSGKEHEIRDWMFLDHDLAMYIWNNQLTVTTLAMKNGKVTNEARESTPWFDSTNPEAEIYINGQKVNIK